MSEAISLEARLDLAAAPRLAATLSEAASSAQLVVDGSKITHLGALCVQVLISAAHTMKLAGGKLELVNLSARAQEHLSAMGLDANTVMEGGQ